MPKDMVLFAGNSNRQLANEVANYLHVKLGKAEVKKFTNGETYVRLDETVRGKDVFILQSLCEPVNDNLMELLLMIDAARRSSVQTVNVVMPWFGYSLQDRQTMPREPISSKVVANMFEAVGTDRVVVLDLHAAQIQGFFNIPVDHLTAIHLFADYIRKKNLKDVVVVSPDAGGVKRARLFGQLMKAPIAMIDKRRPRPEAAEISHVIGDVNGKTAVVIDDVVNSGSTMSPVANVLLEDGAKEVYFCATHAILCGNAVESLGQAPIKEAIFTNTIAIPSAKMLPKMKVLSIAKLLADAISRIHQHKSLSELFETPQH